MNEEDVAALYKNESIKALVTTTRGEGYGLPILEAAASIEVTVQPNLEYFEPNLLFTYIQIAPIIAKKTTGKN
jgi:hypothetical protein